VATNQRRNDVFTLDVTDHRLLAELQADARLSLAELGRRVGLSSPAVADRLRRLEADGVIVDHRTEVRPEALGLALTAIIRAPSGEQVARLAMSTWSTNTTVSGSPEAVIEVLSDPEIIRRWSPIDFELEELDGHRLVAGRHARVAGRLAGRRAAFDVQVSAAGDGRFALIASGPIDIEVEYEVVEDEAG